MKDRQIPSVTDVWTVRVDYAPERPIVPDARTRWVRVATGDEWEAQLLAAQIVACGPCVIMPTRTTILAVEI